MKSLKRPRKSALHKNQLGQTTVEYILIFALAFFAIQLLYRSQLIQGLVQGDGAFITSFKSMIEYSYRHGLDGKDNALQQDYSTATHPSYRGEGESRFFAPRSAYP